MHLVQAVLIHWL